MALFPLGILSAGAGGETFELIQTAIVSGSSTTSVSFSNLDSLSSTYRHLQLRLVGRSAEAVQESNYSLRFNSDATNANYALHGLFGTGSSVSSFGVTAAGIQFPFAGANQTANSFAPNVIDILDAYSTTKNKTVRNFAGQTAAINRVNFLSGLWLNTASITTITLTQTVGVSFTAGSRFSLYGIRG